MNTYKWYYIFNNTEFEAMNLVSKTYTLILDGIGQREILVTKGNYTGLTYDDVFMPLQLNDKNPFEFDSHALYIDETDNVFLGILIED